ncbi:hypothetical protein Q7A53_05385 [Halobacillus rhizosphaerae]|uniref:hypothetical protein n=1 Tax=Halobacillus rhizosphaerae TaxID=3064889 RepID=UPI00398B8E64
MPRQHKSRRELFDEIVQLGTDIQHLRGIVQNEGEVCQREFQEWNDLVDSKIARLYSLKEDVRRYFQD